MLIGKLEGNKMPLECTGFRVVNGVKSDVSGDGRMSTIVKPLEVKQPLVLYNNNNNNNLYNNSLAIWR